MAEYRQYCPVARASEILADRWTPLIVRELLAGSQHFNEIERGLPGISRSLLVSRLRHLEDRGVIQRHHLPAAEPDRVFADRGRTRSSARHRAAGSMGRPVGLRRARVEELDPAVLLWKMHQRVDRSRLPPGRTTIEFDFSGRRGAAAMARAHAARSLGVPEAAGIRFRFDLYSPTLLSSIASGWARSTTPRRGGAAR